VEYPGTKFRRPIRLALLIIFIVAFFIISPAIIMYTAGYRYDWHNGLLKETGSINIDIEPKNAEAYLNNIKLQEKLPIRLNNIVPAKYNLRITLPGYFDWIKEIEVKNKQTNYIKEISLLKKNKPQSLIDSKINNFALSYDGSFILYTIQKNNNTEVWLWNNISGENQLISNIENSKRIEIAWAEENNYALIYEKVLPARAQDYGKDLSYSKFILFNPADPLKQTDIAKNNAPIKKFHWSNSSEPKLYYSTRENIYLYSPITDKSQIITKNIYTDWYMESDQLWTVQPNPSKKQYIIVRDTLGFNSTFNTLDSTDLDSENNNIDQIENNLQILAARENTLLLKTSKNSKMLLVTENSKHKVPAEKFVISKYNNWWLMWSQWELWTYSQNEEPYLLNRSGEQLQQAMPLDEHNTLGLVWADKSTALFPYYSVSHDIINERIITSAADTQNKIIYFINKNKNGIWKLNY